MRDEEILRERLRKENIEFRKLLRTHTLLDRKITQMRGRRVTTPKEDLTRKKLQVEKLHTKDRMEAIVREQRRMMTL